MHAVSSNVVCEVCAVCLGSEPYLHLRGEVNENDEFNLVVFVARRHWINRAHAHANPCPVGFRARPVEDVA